MPVSYTHLDVYKRQEQRNATLRRVLEKIRPYGFFVVCSLIVAAVSVAAQLYIPILCGSAIDMMLGKGLSLIHI